MSIANTTLPATQFDFTVPEDATYAITTILLCNFSPSDSATVDIHLVINDSERSNDNIILKGLELPPLETFSFDTEKIVLDSGDFLSLVAGPDDGTGLSTVAATVSFLEV
jgi:hypothetical protein